MKISIIMMIAMFAIFLVFAIYGIIVFDLSVQEMRKTVRTVNEGFSVNIMHDLDRYIHNRMEDFSKLSGSEIVQLSLKESNEEFRKMNTMTQKESDLELENQTPFIKEIGDEDLTDELVEIINFYRNEYNYDVVEEIFITNKFGANVALGKGTSDYRQDDEEWWKVTKDTGLFISDLKYREEYDGYSVAFGFRIDDENGNFLGVTRVVLTLNNLLHDFINDADIINFQNRNVLLLDRDGRIIYSNGIHDFSNAGIVSHFSLIPEEKEVGTLELTDNQDETRFVSYARSAGYKTFPGFDWMVLVDQSSSTFINEFIELRNSILLVSVIGMAASVAIGLLVSLLVTKPLKKLSRFTESLSAGNFDVKAKKTAIDEINTIGNSFNKMSHSLKKLIETEKQLAESQARIKNERLSAIGELASSMAHNMKNPLATIKSSAEILQRNTRLAGELGAVTNRMNRAVDRISHQIDDVLNYVRITPLNLESVKISEILHTVKGSLYIPDTIECHIPDSDLEIKGDVRKLETVFANLLLNSIQSIGKEKGKIECTIKQQNFKAVIQIQDSGPGIPEDIFSKIFDPLVTSKQTGTGLGLSTCKNIIEQHKGTITAQNNPTKFTITLPLS